MDEAIELCRRYAEVPGDTLEIDVRLIDEAGEDRRSDRRSMGSA